MVLNLHDNLLAFVSECEPAKIGHELELLQAYRIIHLRLSRNYLNDHISSLPRQEEGCWDVFVILTEFTLYFEHFNVLADCVDVYNALVPCREQFLLFGKLQNSDDGLELLGFDAVVHVVAHDVAPLYLILIQTLDAQFHVFTCNSIR